MNNWNLQCRARTCQECGRTFADREVYHTLLFEQRSGFARQDVCAGCWDTQHRHGAVDRKGFVSHWQGHFSAAPPPPPDPIQKDNAESLLRQLLERNDPVWQPAAFILAVMLERKRILRIRQQIRSGGRRTIVYEIPRSGDIFTIPDPDLQLDQLERVQHDVASLLEHGLPPELRRAEEPFLPDSPDPSSSAAAPTPESGETAPTETGTQADRDARIESDPGPSQTPDPELDPAVTPVDETTVAPATAEAAVGAGA